MLQRIILLLIFVPGFLVAQEPAAQRLWLLWDNPTEAQRRCGDQPCENSNRYRSHFIDQIGSLEAQALFDTLQPLAEQRGLANVAHDRLPHCVQVEPQNWVDVNDIELVTDKALTLKGLPGVFADFRGAYAPPGYRGAFGEDVQKLAVAMFDKAGIEILSKEEAASTPGHPRLSIRFSGEVRGCRPWSISLSFKQTVVLSRDFDVVLDTTTWSTSSRQDESNIEFQEIDAVVQALTSFVEAWISVNGSQEAGTEKLAQSAN